MAEIHADPDKLRRFAKKVSASARKLKRLERKLQRRLRATGWQDDERRQFETDFQQTLASISELADQLRNEYVPRLNERAYELDQYHS